MATTTTTPALTVTVNVMTVCYDGVLDDTKIWINDPGAADKAYREKLIHAMKDYGFGPNDVALDDDEQYWRQRICSAYELTTEELVELWGEFEDAFYDQPFIIHFDTETATLSVVLTAKE